MTSLGLLPFQIAHPLMVASEELYEDESYESRQLAALVASKVRTDCTAACTFR